MKPFNAMRKGQGLPLNTIVIAILVIIVLLVIIVFFTTRVGDTGDQLDQQSANQCNISNPAISTVYGNANNAEAVSEGQCTDNNQRTMPGISTEEGQVCCVTLPEESSS